MEYSQEEKIKIQIENNNCIISTLRNSKTKSNVSTNAKTKSFSLKKIQKCVPKSIDNEISLSISKTSDNDSINNKNNDISMAEITDKSIFNSDNKNNFSINKTPDTKKINKEKKMRKIKEAVVKKLNFDFPKKNNINDLKITNRNGNKYPLLNKIISDYQHKPVEKKFKNNLMTKRITKKININLNFKEINLHKNRSYKDKKKENEEEKSFIINKNNINNNLTNLKKKKKTISYNNIFNFNNLIHSNINSYENLKLKIKTRENSEEKEKNKKENKKKLSISINNKEKNIIGNNLFKSSKKSKYLLINAIKRNSYNNAVLETSTTKKTNTYLTSVNNSSILKTNNSHKDKNYNIENFKELIYIKNKIKKQNIISSNNSSYHSHRNTLSDNKQNNKKNNKLYHNKNYLSTYNFSNTKKPLTKRANIKYKDSKIRLLKKMLMIFGKDLCNPIKYRPEVDDKTNKNYKILNNLIGLNIFRDNKIIYKTSSEKNKGKKASFINK